MGDVLKYPVKTDPSCKGAISYKVSIASQIHVACLIAGRVKVSDTDPFEVRVYCDQPDAVYQRKWKDFTHLGELVFTIIAAGVAQHVSIDYFPEIRLVNFGIFMGENAATCIAPENRVMEWSGCAEQPNELFTA